MVPKFPSSTQPTVTRGVNKEDNIGSRKQFNVGEKESNSQDAKSRKSWASTVQRPREPSVHGEQEGGILGIPYSDSIQGKH